MRAFTIIAASIAALGLCLTSAIANPLDKPYVSTVGKPSCGGDLKLQEVDNKNSDNFVAVDVLLEATGLKTKPVLPKDYIASFAMPADAVRKDSLGYLIAARECKFSSGGHVTELHLGISDPFAVDKTSFYGSRIIMAKSVVASKPAGAICLQAEDGKNYHYNAVWGERTDGKGPLVIYQRAKEPGCFTRG
jgi:hypothetical protein